MQCVALRVDEFCSHDMIRNMGHSLCYIVYMRKSKGASLNTGGVLFTSGLFDVNCCTHIGVISSGLFNVIVDVRCHCCRHLSS